MVHIRDLLSYVAKQARNKRRGPAKPAAALPALPAIEVAPENIQKTTRPAKPNLDLARVDLQKTLTEAGIIRKILFVPPSMLASDLLRRMAAAHSPARTRPRSTVRLPMPPAIWRKTSLPPA